MKNKYLETLINKYPRTVAEVLAAQAYIISKQRKSDVLIVAHRFSACDEIEEFLKVLESAEIKKFFFDDTSSTLLYTLCEFIKAGWFPIEEGEIRNNELTPPVTVGLIISKKVLMVDEI